MMKYTIAIDLGGTIIKIGLLQNGHLVDRTALPAISSAGLQLQLPHLEEKINALLLKHQLTSLSISGIGFSFAGLVDSVEHKILSTNQKYDDGPKTDLVEWAMKNWQCPLFLENDARMALLGEWQYGVGKDCKDILMVTIGTGIGSAVLINGTLLKGKHFQAGNLGGHFTVNHHGIKCTCGNIGCMEAEASTWRLPSLIKEHEGYSSSALQKENTLDFNTLFLHVAGNDPVAKEILEHCLSVWSFGIISMIHAFDPELVILSGGIINSAAVIMPALQQKIDQYAWTPWGKVKLVAAAYPDSAALYGADYLVNHKLNS
jgi:glucokinase